MIDTMPVDIVPQKCKLLFIEDDPTVVASLKLIFDDQYETFSATTVEEGIRLFEEIHPEIVLLDLRLPDRNGLEALRAIRKLDQSAPVVILTGCSTRLAAEESLRLGATDYINKPFNSGELSRKIKRLALASSIREKSKPLEDSISDSVETLSNFQDFQNASAAFLHDVSNPLSSLMVGVDFLVKKLDTPEELATAEIASLIQMMSTSVGYLRSLVEQWRSFSELHALMHGKCMANEVINLAIKQVDGQIRSSSILLIVKSSHGQAYIPGDIFTVARVLINLLRNAAEAVTPLGGRIQLSTAISGSTLELTVSDNGNGIPAEVIDQIFLPRFSTKSTGKGLGLFISKKIIEAVAGTIRVKSPGSLGGADFTVTLPLVK